jgi:endonuclease-3
MKNNKKIFFHSVLDILQQEIKKHPTTMINSIIDTYGKNPYLILIGCVLSARTRDKTVMKIIPELFNYAKTPYEMIELDTVKLENILKPIGFYRKKSILLINISKILIETYQGHVPSHKNLLLELPGVGIKTAALVLSKGFNIPAICVDTHVMRITKQMGIVSGYTPQELEKELMNLCDEHRWHEINDVFVIYGQNICTPWSVNCKRCINKELCIFIRSFK